jgi:hypothetical protein
MQTTQHQTSAVKNEIFSCREIFFTLIQNVQIDSSDCSRTLSGTNLTCDEEALMMCTEIHLSARQWCDIKLRVLIGTQLSA